MPGPQSPGCRAEAKLHSHKASHEQKLGSRETGVPGRNSAIGTRQCVNQEVDKSHPTAGTDFMEEVVPPSLLGSTPQNPLYEVRTSSPDLRMTQQARNPLSFMSQMIVYCVIHACPVSIQLSCRAVSKTVLELLFQREKIDS